MAERQSIFGVAGDRGRPPPAWRSVTSACRFRRETNPATPKKKGHDVSGIEDLLLFRAVKDTARGTMAGDLLDEGMAGRGWRCGGEVDLWELRDAAGASDEEPVAVAATHPLGDGRWVRLVAVVVAWSRRGQGIGRRMIEDLADALRAQGVCSLVAAVPSDQAGAMVVMQRAGLRPSHVERANAEADGRDVVWFDLEL